MPTFKPQRVEILRYSLMLTEAVGHLDEQWLHSRAFLRVSWTVFRSSDMTKVWIQPWLSATLQLFVFIMVAEISDSDLCYRDFYEWFEVLSLKSSLPVNALNSIVCKALSHRSTHHVCVHNNYCQLVCFSVPSPILQHGVKICSFNSLLTACRPDLHTSRYKVSTEAIKYQQLTNYPRPSTRAYRVV